jgi:AcrR family transcriptional regulator
LATAHTPAIPDRRSRRRTETREKLFRAAMALFAQRGLAATTIEDITELADVGKGTFFNYFRTKEHVLNALGEIQLGNLAAALEDAQGGEDPISDVLQRLARALAREPGRSPALVRSLMMAHLSNDAVRQMIVLVLEQGRGILAEILLIGQERGEVRRDLDPLILARIFQQTMFGTMLFWSMHPGAPLPEWLEQTIGLYCDAIRSQPEARAERSRRRP